MTPETSPLVPETFGPLQGVKILSSGTIIAQPFAALLAAEMGAEVIQIERPGQGDLVWRNLEFPIEGPGGVKGSQCMGAGTAQHVPCLPGPQHRPGARRSFWSSSPAPTSGWSPPSRGPTSRWGIDDATVLKANPKIVICHVSGYGQERPSRLPGSRFLRLHRPRLRRHDAPHRLRRTPSLPSVPSPGPPTTSPPVSVSGLPSLDTSTPSAQGRGRLSTSPSTRPSTRPSQGLWSPTTRWV